MPHRRRSTFFTARITPPAGLVGQKLGELYAPDALRAAGADPEAAMPELAEHSTARWYDAKDLADEFMALPAPAGYVVEILCDDGAVRDRWTSDGAAWVEEPPGLPVERRGA
jgi:hypothetical protein